MTLYVDSIGNNVAYVMVLLCTPQTLNVDNCVQKSKTSLRVNSAESDTKSDKTPYVGSRPIKTEHVLEQIFETRKMFSPITRAFPQICP